MKNDIEHLVDGVCQLTFGFDVVLLKGVLYKLLHGSDKYRRVNPEIIGIGGLPGVGKSTYSRKKISENYYIINPDRIRSFHPKYHNLNRDNVIYETNDFVTQTSEMLLSVLTYMSCNVAVECTFSNYDYWHQLLTSLDIQLKKYTRKLIFLSAPIEVCYQSMCYRYDLETHNSMDIIPRPADRCFLLDRAKKLENAIVRFRSGTLFDEIHFLYKKTMTSDYEEIDYSEYRCLISEIKKR